MPGHHENSGGESAKKIQPLISPPKSGGSSARCAATVRSGSRSSGNTYFNFLGMLLLLNLFFYGAETLHVDETHIGLLNVALALGIGLGSVAAGYLSGGKIEYGLVPLGAFGLSIFSALLAWPGHRSRWRIVSGCWRLLGFSGGFFIVPIAALLQHRPARENKGQVQATANWLSFVGVFLASGAHWLLAQKLAAFTARHFSRRRCDDACSARFTFYFLLPDALLRFVLWCVTNSIYRIRVVGRDNIPAKGGALFVCNHRLVRRRAAAHRLDRPADALFDVQGHLRKPLDQAVRQNSRRDPDFIRSTSARTDPFAASGERRHPQRRGRLHFCRGPDHAHRAVAAVPTRLRAHHEGCRSADHSRRARRRAGRSDQF